MAVSLLDGSAGAGERLSARNTRPSGRLRPPDRPEATGDASASARPHSRPARLPGCLPARPAARPLAPARNDDSPLQGSMTTRTRFVGAGDMNIQLIRSKELQFFFLSLSFSLSLSLSLSRALCACPAQEESRFLRILNGAKMTTSQYRRFFQKGQCHPHLQRIYLVLP